jgi:hypothetical protein
VLRNARQLLASAVTGKRKKTLQTDKDENKMVIQKSIQN